MYFLSDFGDHLEFSKGRKKGSRDRKKRKVRNVMGRKTDDNNNELRENINTGTSTVRTGINTTKEIRGVSREVRGWLSLANRLGVI